MKVAVRPGSLSGAAPMPGSKSHTIRGLILGTLAEGTSILRRPLQSQDTESCLQVCRALGASVRRQNGEWRIRGTSGRPRPAAEPVDVGNSGTSLFLAMTAAALAEGKTQFTGDEQIRQRSAAPLLSALRDLGATARSLHGNGCVPLVVGGGLRGGRTSVECPTSQYLSSLLIGCPGATGDTTVEVPLLHERPYVQMTLEWLSRLGIACSHDEAFSLFRVPGRQQYPAFERSIPADFSSATFFLVAAAVTGSRLLLQGLDMADTQGDKAVVGMLQRMGCEAEPRSDGILIAGPERLQGAEFDLNATPDALPAMAVAGCLAAGQTRLLNVPQARIKETDRIAVMAEELGRMGAEAEELEDGLVLRESELHGAEVNGRADHRVVMALAVAGLAAEGHTTVEGAEAVAVTFPNFADLMRSIGADIRATE